MPTISEFYGIRIVMRYREKHGPHFHVEYAEYRAEISILDGTILGGNVPNRAYNLVLEWLALHRQELQENWERIQQGQSILPIDPLR